MWIEFKREWMGYRIGDVTDQVAPGVADVLFMRRIAVQTVAPAPPTASPPPPPPPVEPPVVPPVEPESTTPAEPPTPPVDETPEPPADPKKPKTRAR